MPVEAQIDHIPLRKHRLLEFLERQKGPVTAKVASIDLDTRASTVTEMLERCAAQGLVEREANQRPRDYQITEAGRRRLESFRSGQHKPDPESDITVESNVVPGARKKSRVQLLLDRVKKSAEKEEGLEGEGEHTLELSAKKAKTEVQSEPVRSLYHARHELRSLGFFDSKDEVKARIAELEGAVGREAAEQIKRLVSLEGEIRSESDGETLRAVLDLRDALHLPASVFGFPAKDTGDGNTEETSTKNESWWD
jgi:DNA-binding MarR family transcriptional regulator